MAKLVWLFDIHSDFPPEVTKALFEGIRNNSDLGQDSIHTWDWIPEKDLKKPEDFYGPWGIRSVEEYRKVRAIILAAGAPKGHDVRLKFWW